MNDAVLDNQSTHGKMTDYYFGDERVRVEVVHMFGRLVHADLTASDA